MLLRNPYTGHVVDAPEGVAERLGKQGFAPVKPAPKRRAANPKKKQTE